MLDWEIQIKEIEKEIDELLDSGDLDKETMEELLDQLEELLAKQEHHYTLRLVK